MDSSNQWLDRINVGESFPLDAAHVGDCPSGFTAFGLEVSCVLDTGHGGQHVASDGQTVVAVWD